MEDSKFDICVIGGGLWGSAAARYISQRDHIKVCLIGPKEPGVDEYQNANVLGSHYDEGRIACQFEQPGTIWPVLTHRSICSFRHLETLSGINFFSEVGSLICREEGSNFCEDVEKLSQELGFDITICTAKELNHLFPAVKTRPFRKYWYAKNSSGYISPRSLISAQQKVAASQGCRIVTDTVLTVNETLRMGQKVIYVRTKTGQEMYANKVLLCTGAFTNFYDILPESMKLDLVPCSEMVVKVEIESKIAEDKFGDLPPLLCENGVSPDLCDFYLLPPIKYPNGKVYFKLGHGEDFCVGLHTLEDIRSWYCNKGNAWLGQILVKLFNSAIVFTTLVDVKATSIEYDAGVTAHTPNDCPYCGMLTPNLGVLVGGNGSGAGSSDELGKMGAQMIIKGEWDHDLDEQLFKPQLRR
ncbi:uncharacterized protein [Apostichopus japonicus]|uniref:uncharacterized protein isoform X2 n=1 Tax=Stichopus japonicus TaxID=307972 RepID=UPI003AB803FE